MELLTALETIVQSLGLSSLSPELRRKYDALRTQKPEVSTIVETAPQPTHEEIPEEHV